MTLRKSLSKLVETFIATTGTHVPLHVIRECWPSPQEDIPQQDLQGMQQTIVRRLDEVVTHYLSVIMWDSFAFPQVEEENWKKECLSYYPGKIVNIGSCMPRIRWVGSNVEGWYGTSACTLMYEGHMLIYNPDRNFSEWVPIRSVSSSLTSVELSLANDLNNICPYPHSKWELTKAHSPQLMYGRPAGEETDTNSWNKPSDSEEWDEPEHSYWLCCPTLPLEEQGLTWEEVASEPPKRKVVMTEKIQIGMPIKTPTYQLSLSLKAQANITHQERKHSWSPWHKPQENHHMMTC